MRVLTLIFIFSTSLFLTNISALKTEIFDDQELADCYELDPSFEAVFRSLNQKAKRGEIPCNNEIWKVTFRSDRTWSCETGSSYACWPCQTDPDE